MTEEHLPSGRPSPSILQRARHRVRRAVIRQRRRGRTLPGRLTTGIVLMVAALMITLSTRTSHGTDLRPSRNTDLVGLVREQAARNQRLNQQAAQLRADIDRMSQGLGTSGPSRSVVERAAAEAGLSTVHGPAVQVTLNDAPSNVQPEGVDPDLLVVHQQDIQSVANVLWSAGAEAMTIQGQRVTSRTGIKCVGNTVVLHGVPYAPPYVIVAIGNQDRLDQALATSRAITIYKQYVTAYQLGYDQRRVDDVTMPAYNGSLDLRYAQPVR